MADRESDACVERYITGHQSQRMPAVGCRCYSRHCGCLELATQSMIERIPKARGAVVAIVVVAIELVLGQGVPLDELLELQPLCRRQVELLCKDRSVARLVVAEHRSEVDSFHPIAGVTGYESPHEMRLIEIEHPPVVGNVGPARAISDPDRVVSKPFPDYVAPAEREEVDREI